MPKPRYLTKTQTILLFLGFFVGLSIAIWALLHFVLLRKYLLIEIFVAMNVSSFLLFGIDKSMASYGSNEQGKTYMQRVPESFFYFIALLGGSLGIIVGAKFFRHKTRKLRFLMWPIVIFLIQAVSLIYYLYQQGHLSL
jgi:uncharacterized membrane protein YsdA (DUF1294 family)